VLFSLGVFCAARRLKMAEGKRKQLMKYLKQKNVKLYYELIDSLNLSDLAK
jgi:ribosomal protein S15P/S13E